MKIRTPKLLLAILPVLLTTPAFAQTFGGTGKGLDKLDEAAVMSELGAMNLTTLQKRDFEVFDVPLNQQAPFSVMPLLKKLSEPQSVSRRRALAVQVAGGLDALLPKATSSAQVLEQANQLLAYGVLPTQTEMEYFGENPVGQAALKPVADTAKKMLDKAAEQAQVIRQALNGRTNQS